jgi:hypothetical protein
MRETKLIITPKTKVGELLDVYPQLEEVLIDISPSFVKLKNPILRKVVARMASLQQAAIVGNLKVEDLVNRLRKEVGQDLVNDIDENTQYLVDTSPEWFYQAALTNHFDASPIINSGGSPLADVLALTNKLQAGEILELKTPFVPAPIIDLLKQKGFKLFSKREGSDVMTYICR